MDYTRCVAYINLDAVANNFEEIHKAIKPDTKVVAVIKADGYGHGAAQIGKLIEKYDYIWGFATASAEEAFALRYAGLTKPILILGYTFEGDYKKLIANDIRPAVFSFEVAKKLSDIAVELGIKAPIHIKMDTGMSRIGYQVGDDAADEILEISKLPEIEVEGIFTHFSKADETDLSFARKQINEFNKIINLCEARGLNIPLKHCSNSAGIIELPEVNMNLVRAGIIIYGLWPSDEVSREVLKLQPVMELKSRLVHIKKMESGRIISYGGTYETKEGDVIGTVSFGYADGYPRGLSNKGYVLIRGKKAPIVGRVCMDQFMVKLNDIPEVCVLDEVTLVGRDGDQLITIEELGAISGRFNYEFACDISKRVPRVYLQDGCAK